MKAIRRFRISYHSSNFGRESHNAAREMPHSMLKSILKPIIISKRDEIKHLKEHYKKNVLGTVTLNDCLEGGKNAPVFISQHSHEESRDAIVDRFLQHNSTESPHLYESWVWYLLTGQDSIASPDEVSLFAKELEQRRNRFLNNYFSKDNSSLGSLSISSLIEGSLGTELRRASNSILPTLSMSYLSLQPKSYFYLYRKETLKPFHWEVILEDVLDILAITPIILEKLAVSTTHRHHQQDHKFHHNHPHGAEKNTAITNGLMKFILTASTIHDLQQSRNLETVVKQLQHDFLHNSIRDGGHPMVHAFRLVSCTLSDPYLATSSAVQAIPSDEKQSIFSTPEHRLKLLAYMTGGLTELFWDRALMFPLENPKSVDIPFIHKLLDV